MGKNKPLQRRKTKYIIERYEAGDTLVDACDHYGVFPVSFYRALEAHDDLRQRYEAAKKSRSHELAEETVTVADNEKDPAKARNRINARQWLAGKLNRKDYGDHVKHEHEHTLSLRDAIEQGEERLQSALGPETAQYPTGRQQNLAHTRDWPVIDVELDERTKRVANASPEGLEWPPKTSKDPDWLD